MVVSRSIIPAERIEHAILMIRGHKVMLDRDLAALYGVKPIALRQQVRRNLERFPHDFMFQLNDAEAALLVSQNVIPSRRSFGGFLPYVFTQEGVAMLSSVLRSKRAVLVNVEIMRAFVRLRNVLATNAGIARKLRELEKRVGQHDEQIVAIVREIRKMMTPPPEPPARQMGFRPKR